MTRAQAAALALVLVLAAAAAVVLAVRDEARVPVAPREPVQVHTSVSPRGTSFGDRVVARVELVVDRSRVDPGRIRVTGGFRPFESGSPVVRRVDRGPLTELRYRWTLDCLDRPCLPRETARRVVFSPVRAAYPGGLATGTWPALRIDTRVGPQDLARAGLRFDVMPLPSVTARIAPGTLRLVLLVATALALLGAAALLSPELRALLPSRRHEDRRTPLERALAHVRLARGQEREPRRRALERLARAVGDHELSPRIRELAWSKPDPQDGEMDDLADEVERSA